MRISERLQNLEDFFNQEIVFGLHPRYSGRPGNHWLSLEKAQHQGDAGRYCSVGKNDVKVELHAFDERHGVERRVSEQESFNPPYSPARMPFFFSEEAWPGNFRVTMTGSSPSSAK